MVCLKGKDVKPQVNYKEADRITRPQSRVSKPAQGPQLLVYRDREGSVNGTSLRVLHIPRAKYYKAAESSFDHVMTACDKAVQCHAFQVSCHYLSLREGRSWETHLDPIKVS